MPRDRAAVQSLFVLSGVMGVLSLAVVLVMLLRVRLSQLPVLCVRLHWHRLLRDLNHRVIVVLLFGQGFLLHLGLLLSRSGGLLHILHFRFLFIIHLLFLRFRCFLLGQTLYLGRLLLDLLFLFGFSFGGLRRLLFHGRGECVLAAVLVRNITLAHESGLLRSGEHSGQLFADAVGGVSR